MNVKQILWMVLILNISVVFSEESSSEKSSLTEAGAVCTDPQKCPSIEGSLQTLRTSVKDQMCKSMQNECKGIDKSLLKGCVQSSELLEKGIQCGIGLWEGVKNSAVSIGTVLKSLFQMFESMNEGETDNEGEADTGLKAYLHAEFEKNSQDEGTTRAILQLAGSTFGILYDSVAEVYSCLNPTGLTKKVCQVIAGLPLNIFTGVTAGLTTSIYTVLLGIPVGLGVATHKLTGAGGSVYMGAVGLILTMSLLAHSTKFQRAGVALVKASIPVGAIVGAAGSVVSSDTEVQNRIKEKMKERVLELKQQENSAANK